MEQRALLRNVSKASGCSMETVEAVFSALVSEMSAALGQGSQLNCLPDWGRFTPKLRNNPGRQENSPHQPKKAHYYIQFKPSYSFEAAMFTASAESAGGCAGEERAKA